VPVLDLFRCSFMHTVHTDAECSPARVLLDDNGSPLLAYMWCESNSLLSQGLRAPADEIELRHSASESLCSFRTLKWLT